MRADKQQAEPKKNVYCALLTISDPFVLSAQKTVSFFLVEIGIDSHVAQEEDVKSFHESVISGAGVIEDENHVKARIELTVNSRKKCFFASDN